MAELGRKKKTKVYAVSTQSGQTIVTSWEECQKLVYRVRNAKFKSFYNFGEAEAWLLELGVDAGPNANGAFEHAKCFGYDPIQKQPSNKTHDTSLEATDTCLL